MLSIILNTKGLNQNAALIARTRLEGLTSAAVIVCGEDGSLTAALKRAVAMKASRLLILDAGALEDLSGTAKLIEQVTSTPPGEIGYAAIQTSDEYIDLGLPGADSIVDLVTTLDRWPCLAIAANPTLAAQSELSNQASMAELLATLTVDAAAKGISIEKLAVTLSINSQNNLLRCDLSSTEQAHVLSLVVNSFNIEEIFPNHAWDEHAEESAAAAYHTLAATFLRLGDLASASQCLSFSDRLEDSPRSLALKALIASANGETLGAVANMVSSLQQYEERKSSATGRHYLSFKPKDLEVVNTMLHAGLAALNQRNNSQAFEHFASAVFNFDSFYSENRVDRLFH